MLPSIIDYLVDLYFHSVFASYRHFRRASLQSTLKHQTIKCAASITIISFGNIKLLNCRALISCSVYISLASVSLRLGAMRFAYNFFSLLFVIVSFVSMRNSNKKKILCAPHTTITLYNENKNNANRNNEKILNYIPFV